MRNVRGEAKLFAQTFRTYDGALRRARFETAHSPADRFYKVARRDDGTYRIERVPIVEVEERVELAGD